MSSFSISWCDNLVPNKYGTEVYLTCSLHDAQDVIIFQVKILLKLSQSNTVHESILINIFKTKLGDEKTFLGARAVTQEDGAGGNGNNQYADNGYGRK